MTDLLQWSLGSILLGAKRIDISVGVWRDTDEPYMVWMTIDAGERFLPMGYYDDKEEANEMCLYIQKKVREGSIANDEQTWQAFIRYIMGKSQYPIQSRYLPPEVHRPLQQDFFDQLGKRYVPPPFEETPHLFQIYRNGVLDKIVQLAQDVQQHILSPNKPRSYRDQESLIQQVVGAQKKYCVDHATIDYLCQSGLALMEAVLVASNRSMPIPEHPLWIQPNIPLFFRGQQIRGFFLGDFFNVARIDKIMAQEPASVREFSKQAIVRKDGAWQIEIVYDDPDNKTMTWRGTTMILGEYDEHKEVWNTIAEGHKCPSDQCLIEEIGEYNQLVPCSECQQEFDYWTRWIKTLLLLRTGHFRRYDDTTEFEERILTLPDEESSKKKKGKDRPRKTPRTYKARILSLDASYFTPATTQKKRRGALEQDHLLLTHEEALAEGALEVNLPGVLILDFVDVRGYTRILRDPRYYGGQTPSESALKKVTVPPKKDRRQYITLENWKARQRMQQQHKQERITASAYERQQQQSEEKH
jgi:hypothetical protein